MGSGINKHLIRELKKTT